MAEYRESGAVLGSLVILRLGEERTRCAEKPMIDGRMNLLAIIIIVLALAAAGAIIYVAWELSSDKSAINTADRLANRPAAPVGDRPQGETPEGAARNDRPDGS